MTRPRFLTAAGLTILGLTIAACSGGSRSTGSGRGGHPSPASAASSDRPPSSVASTTSASAPQPTPSTPAPTTSSAAGKRASAFWFSVGERFPNGARWRVSTKPPEAPAALDDRSVGTVTFTGPHSAVMLFQAPDLSAEEATSDSAVAVLRLDLKKLKVHLAQVPQKFTVGPAGVPGAFATGTLPDGTGVIVAVAKSTNGNQVYANLVLDCPVADFTADKASFNALLQTFTFADTD